MRIFKYRGDGKVRTNIAGDKSAKRERNERELPACCDIGDAHQYRVAVTCPHNRQGRLYQPQTQREDDRVKTNFRDHSSTFCIAAFLTENREAILLAVASRSSWQVYS